MIILYKHNNEFKSLMTFIRFFGQKKKNNDKSNYNCFVAVTKYILNNLYNI